MNINLENGNAEELFETITEKNGTADAFFLHQYWRTSLGIALFLLNTTYVIREMNYDDFHKNKENIYRVTRIEDEPSGRDTTKKANPFLNRFFYRSFFPPKYMVDFVQPAACGVYGENLLREHGQSVFLL